jgi:micrococcal nuclease|tara:strand:- start:1203 stop:1625 length:423 start_codon:yes stop_codon:yes gene_type:complete
MYEYNCKVKRVVDGDTVDVVIDLGFDIHFATRVRLYGMDTPESRTRNKDEKVRGYMSKDFLEEWMEKDDVIIRTRRDKKGKFGRVLGEMIVRGENINKLMIKECLAVEYYGQSKDDIEKQHMLNREVLIEKRLFNPDEIK